MGGLTLLGTLFYQTGAVLWANGIISEMTAIIPMPSLEGGLVARVITYDSSITQEQSTTSSHNPTHIPYSCRQIKETPI